MPRLFRFHDGAIVPASACREDLHVTAEGEAFNQSFIQRRRTLTDHTCSHVIDERTMPAESTAPPASDKKRSVKLSHRILRSFTAFLLLSILWYSSHRIFFTGPQIRIYQSHTVSHNDSTNSTLRIATYNIAHGRGHSSKAWEKFHGGGRTARLKRLDAIAYFLRTNNLDVIVLNEVDFAVFNSWHVNQAEHIARKAGFPFRLEQRNYDANLFGFRFQAGNAILSRHPIVDAKLIDYPNARLMQKALLGNKQGVVCTITPTNQKPFRLAAVHLDHESAPIRKASARILLTLATNATLPTILAGDFNSSPRHAAPTRQAPITASALDIFTNTFTYLPPTFGTNNQRGTYPSSNPILALDWILIPHTWNASYYSSPQVKHSDHLPIIAEVSTH